MVDLNSCIKDMASILLFKINAYKTEYYGKIRPIFVTIRTLNLKIAVGWDLSMLHFAPDKAK
jgi:hypothetical protein